MNDTRLGIHFGDRLVVELEHDRGLVGSLDLEDDSLRELEQLLDGSHPLAGDRDDSHPDEIVEEHLVLSGRFHLILRHEKGAIAPRVRGVAVIDPLDGDDQSALERGRAQDAQFEGITSGPTVGVTRKNTTAGREDRVRRVGQRFDNELAADPVRPANASNDEKARGQPSDFTGTAPAAFLRPRRSSCRALRTPARRSSERTVSDGWAPLSSQ